MRGFGSGRRDEADLLEAVHHGLQVSVVDDLNEALLGLAGQMLVILDPPCFSLELANLKTKRRSVDFFLENVAFSRQYRKVASLFMEENLKYLNLYPK